jgi:hypothetical protein
MAADAWKFYNTAREFIGDGTIDLDDHEFKMGLYTSTSNAATVTNSVLADLTNEVANANGYTTGGVAITSVISNANQWLRSGNTVRFDVDDAQWTASGGSITARFAVIYDDTPVSPADPLLCFSLLDNTPADVTVTNGNTLTIQINASGVFTLSGAA